MSNYSFKVLWYAKNWKYMCYTVTALSSWGFTLNLTRGTDVMSDVNVFAGSEEMEMKEDGKEKWNLLQ